MKKTFKITPDAVVAWAISTPVVVCIIYAAYKTIEMVADKL